MSSSDSDRPSDSVVVMHVPRSAYRPQQPIVYIGDSLFRLKLTGPSRRADENYFFDVLSERRPPVSWAEKGAVLCLQVGNRPVLFPVELIQSAGWLVPAAEVLALLMHNSDDCFDGPIEQYKVSRVRDDSYLVEHELTGIQQHLSLRGRTWYDGVRHFDILEDYKPLYFGTPGEQTGFAVTMVNIQGLSKSVAVHRPSGMIIGVSKNSERVSSFSELQPVVPTESPAYVSLLLGGKPAEIIQGDILSIDNTYYAVSQSSGVLERVF